MVWLVDGLACTFVPIFVFCRPIDDGDKVVREQSCSFQQSYLADRFLSFAICRRQDGEALSLCL